MPPSNPNYLLKAHLWTPSPRTSTYELVHGHTSVHDTLSASASLKELELHKALKFGRAQ